ncbi:MAG TPA: hypothetical protein DCP28_10050, partial [Cytophagales bacterium]|nr:hypothetical protein [Cytophagales bacterium]
TVAWAGVLSQLRHWQKTQVLPAMVALHNAHKILSYTHPAPQHPPRKAEDRKVQLQAIQGGDWFVESAISAPIASMLTPLRAEVQPGLEALGLTVDWSEPNAEGPMYHRHTHPSLAPLYGALGTSVPEHPQPDQEGVGALWHAVVVPYTPEALAEVDQLVRQVGEAHQVDVPLTFQLPNHRYGYAVINWLYHRADAALESRMQAAYADTKQQLAAAGYQPYRLGWADRPHAQPSGSLNQQWLEAMRQVSDPAGILAPGHYSSEDAKGTSV